MKKLILMAAAVSLFMSAFVPFSFTAAKKPPQEIEKAPKFPSKGIWLNSQVKNTKEFFRHRLTLVYFWDYASINSVREIGILKEWYDRYHPYGFEIIMIHAPEFEFAKKKINVAKAVKRLGIPYPVLLDNDFKLWEKFKTRSWPAKYLINDEGFIIYSQAGEEKYYEFEDFLRKNLQKIRPGVVLPEAFFLGDENKFDVRRCGDMSPETYLGYERSKWWGGEIANKKGVLPGQTIDFHDRGRRAERGFFAEGLWTNYKDHFEHNRDTMSLNDYIGTIYIARDVYAVMHYKGGEAVSRIYVTRDETPVPSPLRGKDIKEDDDGNTYILLQEPRLYYLISGEDDQPHEIRLLSQRKGAAINSFSFSNRCLSEFEHL